MESAEIRLRLVEALTRNDGSHARNNPLQFIEAIAKIETYVVNGNPTTVEPPAPEAEEPKPGKGSKKADKADPDFMD